MSNEKTILETVNELDRTLSKENAFVRIGNHPKIMGQVCTGNKQGLLRLGVELMRVALAVPNKHTEIENWYSEPIEYLKAHPSDFLTAIVRNDELEKTDKLPDFTETPPPLSLKILIALSWFMALGAVSLMVIGGTAVYKWLTQ